MAKKLSHLRWRFDDERGIRTACGLWLKSRTIVETPSDVTCDECLVAFNEHLYNEELKDKAKETYSLAESKVLMLERIAVALESIAESMVFLKSAGAVRAVMATMKG